MLLGCSLSAAAGASMSAHARPAAAAGAGAGNPSIVSALQDRSARLQTAPNQIIGKLVACLDQIEVVRDFAAEGEYLIAREQLRKGALGSLRLTIRDASDVVVFERPNFDEYEKSAVDASLGALDAALRARANGGGSDADIASDAVLLRNAIKEVIEDMNRKAAQTSAVSVAASRRLVS